MSVTEKQKDFLLTKARAMCTENDAELLYLTLSGSTLYGTRIEGKSDLDARGLYLPKFASLALGNDQRSLRLSSGGATGKNDSQDVDLDLWSLQYWLLDLLSSGDTGAMDLLFSPSNDACTLYRNKVLDEIFGNPLKFIDTANGRTYAEYSMGQAKKYGIKGSHLGALKSVWTFLADHCPDPSPDERLSNYLHSLTEHCGDERFCRIQDVRGCPGLFLCRKLHDGNTRMAEFKKRVESDMNRFGDRAKEAERNLGLDYKALSHALRALMQMEELLLTGRIRFPLKEREELIAVKMGNFAWADLENRIVTMMKKVEDLQEKAPYVGVPDAEFAKSCVLSCYGLPAFGLSNFTPSERKYDSRFDAGFDIPPNTLTAIYEKLRTSEQTNGVRILYCCESGSRGWNFASRDSDFDVRFIYAHSRDWYLSVAIEDKPDVLDLGIEKTADGELDINGWELRKTLKLLRKSNGSFLEWLSSPIIYRAASSFLEAMRAFAADCFNPLAVWHHYRGMMERSTVRFEETPSIKAFFYILRPLLCMKWIENGLGLPPMRFDRVMDMVVTETPAKREILRLVNLKKSCGESGILHLSPTLLEYIDVARAESNPPRIPEKRATQLDIDVFFRKIVDST